MLKHRTFKPVALVLPGLIAASSFAAWTPNTYTIGTGFYATANGDTSYAEAKYDRSGYPVWCTRYRADGYRFGDPFTFQDNVENSLVVVSGTWNENSFSYGEVSVTQAGDKYAWAYLDSSF